MVIVAAALALAGCGNAPAADEESRPPGPQPADLILHGGRVVTVDDDFSIAQAIAVRDGRVLLTGSDADALALRGPQTDVIDLGGRMLLPGLIDSHTHPTGAAMYEFDHEVPTLRSVGDVLEYVASRAKVLPEGEWIVIQQVFITRLEERRYPRRDELDRVAPDHPVIFRTGPDASLNSRALEALEITAERQAPEGSRIERDSATGEPTGILRGWSRMISMPTSGKQPSEDDRYERVLALFRDYNATGITTIGDRAADGAAVERYRRMLERGELPLRVAASWHVSTNAEVPEIQERIREVARHDLVEGTPMLRVIGIKVFLDGGMLTGSAYMREPWGLSDIYAIDDPEYRGLRFIQQDALVAIVRTTVESGLQFTAHSVGDGAVHALLDAYAAVDEETPVRATRPCITHSNFMSREAIERMVELGVAADIQPAWLYLDTGTLSLQFSYDRMRYFQPLASLFARGALAGGGSDHMQKIGSRRSINPYDPFLGMSTAITRAARGYPVPLHPEEALTREQAIRFYTINNAKLLFLEKHVGSLEQGKFADMIVVDRDLLRCPIEELQDTRVLRTYLAGRLVHSAP